MKEYGIGIAGIALAIITGFSQFLPINLPDWVLVTGFISGVFLLGIATNIFFSGSKNKPAKSAHLKLHIYNDNRSPHRLSAENIFRWYFLQNIVVMENSEGTQNSIIIPTLFITFEPEVKISTLQVNSPDIQLPRHEVKDFNQRFAIISFSGQILSGTLEVNLIE